MSRVVRDHSDAFQKAVAAIHAVGYTDPLLRASLMAEEAQARTEAHLSVIGA